MINSNKNMETKKNNKQKKQNKTCKFYNNK